MSYAAHAYFIDTAYVRDATDRILPLMVLLEDLPFRAAPPHRFKLLVRFHSTAELIRVRRPRAWGWPLHIGPI